ncbi:hypothetical protein [Nitrosopumilus sp.]|uniref:hypothetical protein n=1 Tax=Nitrosopumilus sp. TaxID=2024843 RepID=UPI00349FF9B1
MTNNKEKMTTKTTKTILFTGIILTLIIPIIGMNVDAQTQQNDQNRLVEKKQRIDENFQQFLNVREQTSNLERDLYYVEQDMEKLDPSDSQIETLEAKQQKIKNEVADMYQQIDRLEQISVELHKIPIEKEELLKDTVSQIVNKYQIHTKDNPSGLLEDVFISSKNEIVYALQSTANNMVSDPLLQQKIENMKYDLDLLATNNDVDIVVSKITKTSSCNYHGERDDYCQPAAGGVQIQGANTFNTTVETTTLSFPATRDSVAGFVMAGHGTLTLDGGEDIYQPIKSGSNKIGDLVVGYDDETCDCSFIDLSPGRTVDAEIVSNDVYNWDIDEYVGASGQSVGNYVYMSGITSNISIGQIDSKESEINRIYAYYVSDEGDSGGPVGRVQSGEFDVFGIHNGFVDEETDLAQYIPYDVIETALDLD